MNILKWMWKILPIMLLAVNATACNDDDDSGKRERPLTFEVTFLSLVCNYTRPVVVNAPFTGKDYHLTVTASPEVTWKVEVVSGDLVTATPSGEQSGSGEITLTVAANPAKDPGKKSEVVITNNANDDTYRFVFTQVEKVLLIPEHTMIGQSGPELFENENSKFNKHYMKESDNVALFWEKSFGTNPQNAERKFNPDDLLKMAEEVYDFMKYDLYFGNKEESVTNKYKFIVYVINDSEGGATGGGNYPVGELAIRPHHSGNPNMVYHEVSHSFQYLALWDSGIKDAWFPGPIFEMTSQWTLLRRSPEWIDQEFNHFTNYISGTHRSLGHNDNAYNNPYMFEYWANKHGVEIMSRIFQETTLDDKTESGQLNFIKTYKRLTHINQEQLNEEMYDAASRFITWDLPRIEMAYAARGANVHTCQLVQLGVTYRISPERCPSNYGYNGIKLTVPEAGTTVKVNFRGIINSSEYNIHKPNNAQWRYGFLAVLKDGSRVYGEPSKEDIGSASLQVPENTEHLWLVVAATPKEIYDTGADNQWPYQFTLDNTEPDGDKCRVIKK